MLNIFIYLIGGLVSALTSLGFLLTFAVVAMGLVGPIVVPTLFGDRRDQGPFKSAGGAVAA